MTSYTGCADNAFENAQRSKAHHGRKKGHYINNDHRTEWARPIDYIIDARIKVIPNKSTQEPKENHKQEAITPVSIAAIIARVENHISLRHTAFIVMVPQLNKVHHNGN